MGDDPSPLTGMSSVEWSRRWDCQGEVDRVPALLSQLWNGTGSFRTLDELRERLAPDHLVHSCVAVRDATPVSVPFLVKLAQDRRTPQRSAVLQLLMRIADAVDMGPVETCFGIWPEDWLTASGRALSRTRTEEWFALLHAYTPDQRRDVLRLLAVASRFDAGGPVLPRLWQSVLDATDTRHLAERLIGLAYATRESPWTWPDYEIEDWATGLRSWLEERPYPSLEHTTRVVRVALRHLPDWIDADTIEALSGLVHEQLLPEREADQSSVLQRPHTGVARGRR